MSPSGAPALGQQQSLAAGETRRSVHAAALQPRATEDRYLQLGVARRATGAEHNGQALRLRNQAQFQPVRHEVPEVMVE